MDEMQKIATPDEIMSFWMEAGYEKWFTRNVAVLYMASRRSRCWKARQPFCSSSGEIVSGVRTFLFRLDLSGNLSKTFIALPP